MEQVPDPELIGCLTPNLSHRPDFMCKAIRSATRHVNKKFTKPANYYSPRTLIYELLEALSFVRFRYVDVPLGIWRNIVRAIELPGPVSTASELVNNLQ